MGMQLHEIGHQTQPIEGSPGRYVIRFPRNAEPGVAGFLLTIAPRAGLCLVQVIEADIDAGPAAREYQARFERTRREMAERYGRSEEFCPATPEADPAESQENANVLAVKHIRMGAIWTNELPDRLESVILELIRDSAETGYLRQRYEFTNFEACSQEIFELEKALD